MCRCREKPNCTYSTPHQVMSRDSSKSRSHTLYLSSSGIPRVVSRTGLKLSPRSGCSPSCWDSSCSRLAPRHPYTRCMQSKWLWEGKSRCEFTRLSSRRDGDRQELASRRSVRKSPATAVGRTQVQTSMRAIAVVVSRELPEQPDQMAEGGQNPVQLGGARFAAGGC
jgi:hypothetical protein